MAAELTHAILGGLLILAIIGALCWGIYKSLTGYDGPGEGP